MYHIVYLTTNLVNQKIYVGVHSTYNLNDGYLGSGSTIKKSIKKYGRESFKRVILYYCLDCVHAYDIEKSIVDDNFTKRKDTYNITRGGRSYLDIIGKTYEDIYGIEKSVALKKSFGSPKEKHPLWGKGHTVESRHKISNNHANVSFTNNGRARKWKVIDPNNVEYLCEGNFIQFCLDHHINSDTLKRFRGQPVTTTRKNKSEGWSAISLD